MSVIIPGVPVSVDRVFTVHGDEELVARAGHLLEPSEEFVCVATDTSTWARPAQRGKPLLMRHPPVGDVAVYKLYTPRAVADPADGRRLAEISAKGVRIRIYSGQLAHEAIVIDRKVAILAGPPVAGVRSYSVVQVPEVVAAVRSLYQATWESAAELETVLDMPPAVDEDGLAILRMLAAGRKDESAARGLRMSVRTYRRRVADLMALLGADSRFQAGVRAKALGLPV